MQLLTAKYTKISKNLGNFVLVWLTFAVCFILWNMGSMLSPAEMLRVQVVFTETRPSIITLQRMAFGALHVNFTQSLGPTCQ